MTVWYQALRGICGSLILAVVLQGCATSGWVHPPHPPSDLATDQAACAAQLPQETQGGATSLYVAEPFWVYEFRRCMQRKGWSPPHWQFSSRLDGPGDYGDGAAWWVCACRHRGTAQQCQSACAEFIFNGLCSRYWPESIT